MINSHSCKVLFPVCKQKNANFLNSDIRKMDWLARSIANSLKLEDDDDENDNGNIKNDNPNTTTSSNASDPKSPEKQNPGDDQHRPINSPSASSSPSSTSTPRGVKEDLSELTKSLTRQLWGVASFLAPPPSDQPKPAELSNQSKTRELSDPEASDEALIAGIRSDFAEIGGKFKTGISRLSSNIAVSEITKIASNFLQIGPEQDTIDQDLVGNAVGVTEEVIAFARNIAMHPETWLDFPVPDNEDFDDFDMSDSQQDHALAVERLAPSLASLRIELCPGYMSEGCFWKIYFVLLHPRLNKHDAELLSTTQIMEARAMLMQELNNQTKEKTEADWSGIGSSYSKESAGSPHEEHLSDSSSAQSVSAPIKKSVVEGAPYTMEADFETQKDQVQSTEVQIVDKSVIEEEQVKQATTEHSQSSSSRVLDVKYEDDGDDWLKEESSEIVGVSGSNMPLGNDDDVSFSDLEDDDGDVPTSYKKVTYGSDSSTKDSRDWVQLSSSSPDSVKDNNSAGIKQVGSGQVSALSPETKESNDWLDVDDIDVM